MKPVLLALLAAPAFLSTLAASADDRRSGLDFMTPATQALQRDDGLNPAMLWVQEGASLWASRGCVRCHGDAAAMVQASTPLMVALFSGPLGITAGRITPSPAGAPLFNTSQNAGKENVIAILAAVRRAATSA